MKKTEILEVWENAPETVFRTTSHLFPYVVIVGVETRKNRTNHRKSEHLIVEEVRIHDGNWVQQHTEYQRSLKPAQFRAVYADDGVDFQRKQAEEAREAKRLFEEARQRREREQAVAHLNDIVTDRRRNELRSALQYLGLLGEVRRERDGGVYVCLVLPPESADVVTALLKGEMPA